MNEYQDEGFQVEDSPGRSGSIRAEPQNKTKTSQVTLPHLNMKSSQLSAQEPSASQVKKTKGSQPVFKLPGRSLSKSRSKQPSDRREVSVDSSKQRRLLSNASLKRNEARPNLNKNSILKNNSVESSTLMNSKLQEKLVLRVRAQTQSEKAEQYFCHERGQLEGIPIDQLNRLNQRAKQGILRINQQLSIKVNTLLLEKQLANKHETKKSIEEMVALLASQIENNETRIQGQQVEKSRLRSRPTEEQSQEYEFNLLKQIGKVREAMKKERKTIVKIQKQLKLGEIKMLHEETGEKAQHIANQVKQKLFACKEEMVRNGQILSELDGKLQSIGEKQRNKDYALETVLEEARQKNLNFDIQNLTKRYNLLKAKRDKMNSHNINVKNIHKRQVEKHSLQIRHLRNEIKNYQRHIDSKVQQKQNIIQEALALIHKIDPSIFEGTSTAQAVEHFQQIEKASQKMPASPLKPIQKSSPVKYQPSLKIQREEKDQKQILLNPGFELGSAIDPDNEFAAMNHGDMESLVDTARRQMTDATTKQQQAKEDGISQTANISQHSIKPDSAEVPAAPRRFNFRRGRKYPSIMTDLN